MDDAAHTVYEVRANNTATASTNKIHDDAVARQYGFSGGLVPGVDVYAYMTHPVVARFGRAFLERGRMHARFRRPVYDGRLVTVDTTGADALALVVRDDTGEECATGNASSNHDGPTPSLDQYPRAALPNPVPEATAEALRSAAPLGTVDTVFDAERAGEYLDAIRESDPRYRLERIAHPGWLLRRANRILARNVALGPWIHVESEVLHFGIVRDGSKVTTLGHVTDLFERGGHEFVTLDVLVVANDNEPVLRVEHTAIYRPRTVLAS